MANNLKVREIDIGLLEELVDGGFINDWDGLTEVYMKGIARKLESDTNISFRADADNSIENKQVGIVISARDVASKTYQELLNDINMQLGGSGSDARFEADLRNRFGYTFGDRGSYIPYFESAEEYWKAYSDYSQEDILELMYYGIYGEYHKDRSFAYELEKKYLTQDDWNKPYYYSGRIDELGIDVQFLKNGKMKIKTKMPREFWERIHEFYSIVDPNFNHHSR